MQDPGAHDGLRMASSSVPPDDKPSRRKRGAHAVSMPAQEARAQSRGLEWEQTGQRAESGLSLCAPP